jgi:hypothetical protein
MPLFERAITISHYFTLPGWLFKLQAGEINISATFPLPAITE